MWQQAELPHPPLPVSHDQPDDTRWQGWEMAAKETPRWTPSTHTYTPTHPRLQGFAINPTAGEDNGRGGKGGGGKGGEVKEGGDAVEMQKSGTGYRSNYNIIQTKAHTSIFSIKPMVPFFLLFILIEGKWIPEFVNMESVAHIFLHKVGNRKLVCFVLKTLFIIDPWEYVFCSDLRPKGVFFCMLRKLWANESDIIFHLTILDVAWVFFVTILCS